MEEGLRRDVPRVPESASGSSTPLSSGVADWSTGRGRSDTHSRVRRRGGEGRGGGVGGRTTPRASQLTCWTPTPDTRDDIQWAVQLERPVILVARVRPRPHGQEGGVLTRPGSLTVAAGRPRTVPPDHPRLPGSGCAGVPVKGGLKCVPAGTGSWGPALPPRRQSTRCDTYSVPGRTGTSAPRVRPRSHDSRHSTGPRKRSFGPLPHLKKRVYAEYDFFPLPSVPNGTELHSHGGGPGLWCRVVPRGGNEEGRGRTGARVEDPVVDRRDDVRTPRGTAVSGVGPGVCVQGDASPSGRGGLGHLGSEPDSRDRGLLHFHPQPWSPSADVADEGVGKSPWMTHVSQTTTVSRSHSPTHSLLASPRTTFLRLHPGPESVCPPRRLPTPGPCAVTPAGRGWTSTSTRCSSGTCATKWRAHGTRDWSTCCSSGTSR